jgi:hypothetical protein
MGDWEKELGILSLAGIAVCAMFTMPNSDAMTVVVPCITAVAGLVTPFKLGQMRKTNASN